ncbi:hypothetical protein [Mucilaginibacter sp. UYCu711]|uniref:hypothetical protein n=1 Tax=Mucilaginibacter sp. UYCu711 TaxID=3156339 RepID=UPI003D192F89
MAKTIFKILGILLLLAAFAANLQYASTNYGVRTNVLAKSVINQRNYGDSLKLK